MKQLENPEQQKSKKEENKQPADKAASAHKKRSLLLPMLIFLVFLGLLGAAGYFGRLQLMAYHQQLQADLSGLKDQLQLRVTRSQLETSLRPLQQSTGQVQNRLGKLEQGQQNLLASTKKLYDLYGRDKNDWKLAEVEYLMSVAQHKLILENDFEGAAKTLDASSALIAELADPGLLPVRVQISEEMAQLKTRKRPDLVGMTLLLSRLGRQITVLKPGYQSKAVEQAAPEKVETAQEDAKLPLEQRLRKFATSLVTINTSKPRVEKIEKTAIIDVTEKLEDNLKLTRWTVLERDASQYRRLMQQNVDLFKQYYDLENAANADFYGSLVELQKSSIKPELPDISGSLRLLREIVKKREGMAQQEADNG